MFYHGKARVSVREVVLHCAAIRTGQFDGLSPFQIFATVNRWHTERGFKHGFGYHGLITPRGVFYKGRPFDMIGAHVVGRNVGTLGFLLVESKQIKPPSGADEAEWLEARRFADFYTAEQGATLRALLEDLNRTHGIEKVSGHNDYAPRLCPGFKVQSQDWI